MNIDTLIVVVTYNSSDYIENCLSSILSSSYKKWFLTIIDNNSSDNTIQKINNLIEDYPAVKDPAVFLTEGANFNLTAMKKNAGFAPAINYAVKSFQYQAKTPGLNGIEYLVCINPDLFLKENTISELLSTFESFNDCGVAGALIYDYDGKTIQHAGGRIYDNYITSHITRPLPQDRQIHTADYATGALIATKLKIFKMAGGFDTGYRPAYFEELDYCKKMKRMGLKTYINLKAVARHFEGASSKKFSGKFYNYYHKNRIRCAVINCTIAGFFKKFIPAEIKWLRTGATSDQRWPLVKAYFLNFVFLFYNLIIKIKNSIIISRYKNLQDSNAA
jgi:GT2 family glycosyltransferase